MSATVGGNRIGDAALCATYAMVPTPAVGDTTALNPRRRSNETMSRPFATALQQRAYEMSESVIDVVR